MKVQRTTIVKVRLTDADMAELDELKCELAEEVGWDVPITAVVRAATRVGIAGRAQRPAIAELLRADTVRRGRPSSAPEVTDGLDT